MILVKKLKRPVVVEEGDKSVEEKVKKVVVLNCHD